MMILQAVTQAYSEKKSEFSQQESELDRLWRVVFERPQTVNASRVDDGGLSLYKLIMLFCAY